MLFQIVDWNYFHEEDEDGVKQYKIRLFGRTKENKTIYVKVNNFNPYFYVEIDRTMRKDKINLLMEEVKKKVYPKENVDGFMKYEIEEKYKFYGFTNATKFPFLKLIFHNYEAYRSFERVFNKSIKNKKYNIYESNIEPFLRCMHIQNLDAVGWVEIKDGEFETLDNNTTCSEINIACDYTALNRYEDRTIMPLVIASYDIECVSKDGSFPQPERDEDYIIQIGTTFSRFGEMECYYKHMITFGECTKIEGVDVECYQTEKEMLLAWTELMRRTNPDVLTGYNIFGFDFEYMMKRAQKLGIEKKFSRLSRINGEECKWQEKKLASSALGDNILKYYDMTGRIIIDLMKVAQRDFKLASYKLDNVASSFIKEGIKELILDKENNKSTIITKSTYGVKVDQYITIYYNDSITDNKHMDAKKFQILELENNKIVVDGIIDDDVMSMGYKVFWCQAKDDISPQDIFDYQKKSPLTKKCKYRGKIAKYCIQDCELVSKLMAKLQVLTNNIGMANVCHVPLSYLFMRGQGVKIFSLVSRRCREENHLIPVLKKPKSSEDTKNKNVFDMKDGKLLDNFIDELNNKNKDHEEDDDEDNKYEGAIVFPPKKGVYFEPIPVLDYNSLYPNSMVQRNLSHECNVFDELDEKFGYLTSHKYHEVTYNTSYIFSDLYKEFKSDNVYIDFLRLILGTFIPKIKLDYSNVLDEDDLSSTDSTHNTHNGKKQNKKTNNIIAKYNKDGEYIEEPLLIRDEKLQDSIKYLIKDSYNNLSAIIKIIMVNIVRLSKIFLNKTLEINNNKEKKTFEIYTEIFKKKRLWIELEYSHKSEKIVIYKVCKFAEKADGSKGIIPQILMGLLAARKKYKNDMEEEPDPFKKSILDGLQLAYKVTANSLYGQTGSPVSPIFMKDIAAATTATGRQMLQYSRHFIEEEFGPLVNYALTNKKKYIKFANKVFDVLPYKINSYGSEFQVHIEPNVKIPEKRWINPKGGYNNKDEFIEKFYDEINKLLKPDNKEFSIDPKIIYGDSVTGDTPLIVKNKTTNTLEIKTIDSLNSEWKDYKIDNKEFNTVDNYDVWTERGWTKINKIIRHKTKKHIYEILTHTGFVRVTEDHSLVKKDLVEIKPKDCVVGTELLHSYPEIINKKEDNFTPEKAYIYGIQFGKNINDTINNDIINGSSNDKIQFLKGYCDAIKHNINDAKILDCDIIETKSQISAAGLFLIVKSLGYNASLNTRSDKENIFRITYSNNTFRKNKDAIKKMTNIGLIDDYVYDLETENHHFAAGVGEIVVHNTDSVFFNPKITDIETGEVQKDKRSLEICIQLGLWTSEALCKLLPDPQKMAYEKVLYPFAILTKKRYVGNLYEEDPNKYYQKSMGIVLKRRDNAPIVKVVVGGIINEIMNKKSAKGAVEYTKKTLKQILMNKYPIDKFIITKTLREKYADRTRITHAVLADRMGKRDPGNKPLPNDRIPYAFIQVDKEVELQGDRVEHPEFIEKNNLKLDYLFYITNQIMIPAVQFLELLVGNPESIFEEYIIREQNRRKGFKPVNFFLKTLDGKENDIDLNDDNQFDDELDEYKKNKQKNKVRVTRKQKIVEEEEEEDFHL